MTAPTAPLDLLIVDGDGARHDGYRAVLGDLAGDVVAAVPGDAALLLAAARPWAAMLVNLDTLDGVAGGGLVAALAAASAAPLVLVSESVARVEACAAGSLRAFDYVPAPIVPGLLRAKVSLLVDLAQAQHGLKHAESQVAEMSRAIEAMGGAANDHEQASRVLRNAVGEQIHRTKNLFAIIQSIAVRTVSDGRDIADAREALLGRLRALARAYQLVVSVNGQGTEIADVVEAELGDTVHRISASGPPVRLTGSIVQTFALAIHELATNAVRHGALGAPEGSAAVGWAYFDQGGECYLEIAWREQGGPPVIEPPKYGFGLSLVSSLAGSRTAPSLRFDPGGFSCHMRLPQAVLVVS